MLYQAFKAAPVAADDDLLGELGGLDIAGMGGDEITGEVDYDAV